jgi:class 3 adenylate cyclase/alpha-beta hydrolase superfamily lysophospholipase
VADVVYAQAGDGMHLAYCVLEAEPSIESVRDVVMVSGGLFPLESFEEEPGFARLLDGLRALGPVIIFDRRGIGLSDPISDWERPIVDQWTGDLAAVVDASDARDIVLVGWDGFGIASRYAATHPERVSALVLYEPFLMADDEWQAWADYRSAQGQANVRGEEDILSLVAPSRAEDREFRDWYARAGRLGASPSMAPRIWASTMLATPRDALVEQVRCPALVLHRRENRFATDHVMTDAARRMPHATLVELDGRDHFPFVGDVDALVAEITAFVVGERRLPAPRRFLSAVLFTDLVGSTERAAALGDEDWRLVLDRHDRAVRIVVGRRGGSVVKTTGDGVLALLPSAGLGLRAATEIRRDLAAEGLDVRIGVHVGDIDRRGDDVSGLAVNIASRVMSKGNTGEIVVTASVVAAVAGETVGFATLGNHDLKGVPGVWELFRVTDDG